MQPNGSMYTYVISFDLNVLSVRVLRSLCILYVSTCMDSWILWVNVKGLNDDRPYKPPFPMWLYS